MEDWKQKQQALGAARLKLAQEIALALTAMVKLREGNDYDHRYVTLVLEKREIHLGFHDEHGVEKIRFSGGWPRETDSSGSVRYVRPRDVGAIKYDESEPEIGVTAAKGPEAIAKDLRRRFLPEFIRVYDAMVERISGNEENGRRALKAAAELAGRSGKNLKGDKQEATFYASEVGGVRVSVYGDGVSVSFDQRLSGLSMSQAKKILAVLAGK